VLTRIQAEKVMQSRPAAEFGRQTAPGKLAADRANRHNLCMVDATAPRSHPSRRAGFSLIELLIVMAIAAILVLVALPAYNESVRKNRRSEAMTALSTLQQAQERWRGGNAAYTTTLSDLGLEAASPWQYYELSVAEAASAPLSTAYMAMAYGKSGTSQADDASCRLMGVRLLDGNLSYAGCGGSCTSFSASDFQTTHTCWPQ
jgi:type IV pilus assembly protein PilE